MLTILIKNKSNCIYLFNQTKLNFMNNKLLLILPVMLVFAYSGFSQTSKNFVGSWQGKLNVGVELRIVFHIKEDGKGGFVSTADSPDQGALGMPCSATSVNGSELTISMETLKASYSGTLKNDTLIEGIFTQGGSVPLVLTKTNKPTVRNRPQTPQAPFPYTSEDVLYNTKENLQLGATITVPEGKGPFPAAILITGSGPQNRDEEIMGHKPFAILADYLTRKGFIVLRADDRGIGKSTGEFGTATSADFANDVNSSVEYLLTRSEVDKKKIGLIGHSEGGMIAPMVATKRKDINFIVLLAGPGVKIIDLMTEQNAAILRSANISKEATAAYLPFYKSIITQLLNATDTVAAYKSADEILQKWLTGTNDQLVTELGINKKEAQQAMISRAGQRIINALVQVFSGL